MSVRKPWAWIFAALCCVTSGFLSASMATAAGLPDGRVYEKVSSLSRYGSEVYQPILHVVTGSKGGYGSNLVTYLPFEASSDGSRVAFVGGLSEGGNEFSGYEKGNEYLGTHLPDGGWAQTNISPSLDSSTYSSFTGIFGQFSSDLTIGFLESNDPLSSEAPGFVEAPSKGRNYEVPYSTSTSGSTYIPLFTTKPPYRSKESFRTEVAGVSSDSSHVLFSANDALTGAAEGRPAAEGGAGSTFENQRNLYESAGGQLRLVNVLPNNTTHVNAEFGSGSSFSLVISGDGSRIFWTDLATGHIYVRENAATTVEVSSAGAYQSASADGSVVFYTNGDLYEFEVQGARTIDLTPGVPVEKVVGASEDGKYVYYLTNSGALNVWHDGTTSTIGAYRVTRSDVTPDGRSIVFTSEPGPEQWAPIMVYNAGTAALYCVSCTSGGTTGALPRTSKQTRWISADGNRVFFDSQDPLLPQAANGMLDVYEWERPGSNGCSVSTGCLYLLSGGTSIDHSYLADASENGDDAFVITREKLISSDDDEMYDLYDLRVNGYTATAPPACAGSGCQGVPGAPPVFATPSSLTFEGVGNFAAPVETKAKAKAKAKAKEKKKVKHKKKKSKAKKSARKAGGPKRSGSKGGRS